MTRFFRSLETSDLESQLDKMEELYKITEKHYTTCFYDQKFSKIWHCVMVSYTNK